MSFNLVIALNKAISKAAEEESPDPEGIVELTATSIPFIDGDIF